MISNHLFKIKRTSNYDFINRSKFYRLDRNERNFPFPKNVIKNLYKSISDYSLQAYPGDKINLISYIAKLEKLNKRFIEIIPGSDTAIKYIFEIFSFKKSKFTSIYPTYGMLEVYSKIYRSKLFKVNLNKENFSTKVFFKKGISWIYIANPNQPDGKIISLKKIKKIIQIAQKKKIFVVIDEAYISFSRQGSIAKFVKKFNNLVVLKTFSKSVGLAGLRIGYLIASPKFIQAINTVRPIFDVSSLSIKIAEYFLKNKKINEKYITEVSKTKNYMIQECKKRNLEYINTQANFFYIKIKKNKIKKLHKTLLKNNILVRSNLLGNFKYIDGTIRVTLGEKKIMKKLFKIIDRVKFK